MSAQKAKTEQNKQSHPRFPADLESPEHNDRKKDAENVNDDRQYFLQLSYGETKPTQCTYRRTLGSIW